VPGQHRPVDDIDAAAAQLDRPGALQGPQHLVHRRPAGTRQTGDVVLRDQQAADEHVRQAIDNLERTGDMGNTSSRRTSTTRWA
jgi:hypothetical protein